TPTAPPATSGRSLGRERRRDAAEDVSELGYLLRRYPLGHALLPHQRARGEATTADLGGQRPAVERPLLLAAHADVPLFRRRQRRRTGRGGRGRGRLPRPAQAGGDLLADREPDAEADPLAGAAAGVVGRVLDRVGGLELGVLVEIARDAHRGALVEHRLDLRRHRDVLDDELRDVDAVFAQVLGEHA